MPPNPPYLPEKRTDPAPRTPAPLQRPNPNFVTTEPRPAVTIPIHPGDKWQPPPVRRK
jgi:hypothetical protein